LGESDCSVAEVDGVPSGAGVVVGVMSSGAGFATCIGVGVMSAMVKVFIGTVTELNTMTSGSGFATGIGVGVMSVMVRVCIGTVAELNTMTSGAMVATGTVALCRWNVIQDDEDGNGENQWHAVFINTRTPCSAYQLPLSARD